MSDQTYGKWLRDQRRVRGITQAELSRSAELSFGQASKYERGVLKLPSEDVRDRIHAVLGTSDSDLADAGVLRWLHVGGRSILVPADDEPVPRVVNGVVPYPDAIAAISDAARRIQWTPSMLESIVKQIEFFEGIQSED